jgi:hypothetical protein
MCMVLVVIIYVVLANNTTFMMVGRYHLHVVYLITLPYIVYQLPIQSFIECLGQTHIYIPSAGHRVVPLLRPFVHVGGTKCAKVFD